MKKAVANKNYMSIGVSVVREQQFSALAFVVRGQDNARKSATIHMREAL